MKSVECTGVGFTQDNIPAFVFEVELHDGQDFDGKFNIAFGIAQRDNKRQLAILHESPDNIIGLVKPSESQRVIDALLDTDSYVVCINYENADYEIPDGQIVPILGRIVGREFDWVEKTQLTEEGIRETVEEMNRALP